MSEIIEIRQTEMLQAINRSEVDMQISTAKQYPRDMFRSLERIKDIATLDQDTAADCFYALSRQGQRIEGVSVRLAEIIAGAWGNLRVQTRIVGNDGKTVTAQGVCHDLETNVAVCVEVKRRITDKNGRTYSEDMQVTTGNAASAIAFRNAVLKVVPKAVTNRVIRDIREVAIGRSVDLETRRKSMIDWFAKIGVSLQDLLTYCNVKRAEEIDNAMVFELRGLANAIKEGTTTVQDTFRQAAADTRKMTDAARKKAEENLQRVNKAISSATGKPAAVDTETGEVIADQE